MIGIQPPQGDNYIIQVNIGFVKNKINYFLLDKVLTRCYNGGMSFLQTTDNKNKRKLTDKQEKFLNALAGEAKGDAKQALVVAGYEPTSYYMVLDSLKEEIVDVANTILAHSAPKAAAKLVDVLDSDAPIPQVGAKLQAAQTLLDRVGISKRERVDVTHSMGGGIFLLPDKEEVVIDAKDAEYEEIKDEDDDDGEKTPSEKLQDELEPIITAPMMDKE